MPASPPRKADAGSVPRFTTIYSKTNRYRLVFFRPLPPVLARVPGHGLLSLPIPKLPFLAWIRLYFVLCSLLPS